MSQQTAVEYLIKAFQGAYGDKVINVVSVQVEQANKMFEQQIMNAYTEADTFPQSYHNAENYYSETFKE